MPGLMSMIRSVAIATVSTCLVATASAGAYCGGFDLANHGQARQCLSDSNSRNGCMNRYGVGNSCWRSTSQNKCCNHGVCAGIYDRYNSHCRCDPGWKGKRCDQRAAPPPPPPARCPPHAHIKSNGKCACDTGYKINAQRTGCAAPPPPPQMSQCPRNAHAKSNGKCACDTGYKVNAQRNGCEAASFSSRCPTNAHGTSNGKCACNSGYKINAQGNGCAKKLTAHSLPPPPPSPPRNACSGKGERACLASQACGWCIPRNWNSKCVPTSGRRNLDCSKGWEAGGGGH